MCIAALPSTHLNMSLGLQVRLKITLTLTMEETTCFRNARWKLIMKMAHRLHTMLTITLHAAAITGLPLVLSQVRRHNTTNSHLLSND